MITLRTKSLGDLHVPAILLIVWIVQTKMYGRLEGISSKATTKQRSPSSYLDNLFVLKSRSANEHMIVWIEVVFSFGPWFVEETRPSRLKSNEFSVREGQPRTGTAHDMACRMNEINVKCSPAAYKLGRVQKMSRIDEILIVHQCFIVRDKKCGIPKEFYDVKYLAKKIIVQLSIASSKILFFLVKWSGLRKYVETRIMWWLFRIFVKIGVAVMLTKVQREVTRI